MYHKQWTKGNACKNHQSLPLNLITPYTKGKVFCAPTVWLRWEAVERQLRDSWETAEWQLSDSWVTAERQLWDNWETAERLLRDRYEDSLMTWARIMKIEWRIQKYHRPTHRQTDWLPELLAELKSWWLFYSLRDVLMILTVMLLWLADYDNS